MKLAMNQEIATQYWERSLAQHCEKITFFMTQSEYE